MKRSVVSRTARPNGGRARGCPPWLANHHPSGMTVHVSSVSTNDAAKDEAQATLNMRVQRRSHASATWWAKKRGASRAFACASCQTNCTDSSLNLPPVSLATTTRKQRVDATNSGYVDSLSILAWVNTMSATRSAM